MPTIAPSILAADFSRLGEEVKAAVSAGVEYLHLDIMDGHFVSNISFGPDISAMIIKQGGGIPMDAHLMVANPESLIEPFARAGVELITFHLELDARRKMLPGGRWVYFTNEVRYPSRIEHIIDLIRRQGIKVGLAINPPTDPKLAGTFLDKIDRFLIMSVNPGFGGQDFIEDTFAKVERAVKYREKKKLKFDVQVDGGVGPENSARLIELGVDSLVCGTSFFGSNNYSERLKILKGNAPELAPKK